MIRRRLYAEIRVSKLAIWSRRLATFALPVLALAILLHRTGAIEYYAAVVLLLAVLLLSLCALLLGIAAFVVIWNDGLRGLGAAMLGVFLGLFVLAYPVAQILRGITLPPIGDLSTDTAEPPRFQAIASLRPSSANRTEYPGFTAAELQRKFYPAVRTVEFDSEAEEIFTLALGLVQRNGWRLADSVRPAGNRDAYIEAVTSTPIMGFREDIVIRVRKAGHMVRVDMRSASRYGQRDFGTNARRIEAFLLQLAEARRRPR